MFFFMWLGGKGNPCYDTRMISTAVLCCGFGASICKESHQRKHVLGSISGVINRMAVLGVGVSFFNG